MLQEALDLDPGNRQAAERQGLVQEQLGSLDLAERTYRDLTQRHPGYAPGHLQLGGLLLQRGRLAEGESELRAAIRIDPDLPAAHYGLALVLSRRGALDDAADALREVVRLQPDNSSALRALASLLSALPPTPDRRAELDQIRNRLRGPNGPA
jgi:tetratricopeptide (TPR) repeat protein